MTRYFKGIFNKETHILRMTSTESYYELFGCDSFICREHVTILYEIEWRMI